MTAFADQRSSLCVARVESGECTAVCPVVESLLSDADAAEHWKDLSSQARRDKGAVVFALTGMEHPAARIDLEKTVHAIDAARDGSCEGPQVVGGIRWLKWLGVTKLFGGKVECQNTNVPASDIAARTRNPSVLRTRPAD